ncbi:GNAT family N-acetyltransferase [Pedobacter sp. ASV28]|uniref:GNAT family N-acetyltransferase n=1 Tax=Pedobacter sp. ASV28 TaxID=2795123 RepID=UPI0018EDD0FD|nr:GNAT family N-acetyltransferase [Pedobacter sp. ASV28]
MVKFIPLELTLQLRSKVLRGGAPPEVCIFPTDQQEGVFHLAYYVVDEIATIATFFPQQMEGRTQEGYQLRGMATDEAFLGKGYGSVLLKYGIAYIQNTNAKYIWCNARSSAVGFYQKLGFVIASDEFEIQGVGPHYKMTLNFENI